MRGAVVEWGARWSSEGRGGRVRGAVVEWGVQWSSGGAVVE